MAIEGRWSVSVEIEVSVGVLPKRSVAEMGWLQPEVTWCAKDPPSTAYVSSRVELRCLGLILHFQGLETDDDTEGTDLPNESKQNCSGICGELLDAMLF